jgi:hypothetical protein
MRNISSANSAGRNSLQAGLGDKLRRKGSTARLSAVSGICKVCGKLKSEHKDQNLYLIRGRFAIYGHACYRNLNQRSDLRFWLVLGLALAMLLSFGGMAMAKGFRIAETQPVKAMFCNTPEQVAELLTAYNEGGNDKAYAKLSVLNKDKPACGLVVFVVRIQSVDFTFEIGYGPQPKETVSVVKSVALAVHANGTFVRIPPVVQYFWTNEPIIEKGKHDA